MDCIQPTLHEKAAPLYLAIDPGTTKSGWVLFDGKRVLDSGIQENSLVLERIKATSGYAKAGLIPDHLLAVERFEARGMPISEDSIETIIWTGRFVQAWHTPSEVIVVKRSKVKLHLCGTSKAKDPNVRQAVLDRVGSPGVKKNPGPTYGVTSHAWAALAVAVTAIDAEAA